MSSTLQLTNVKDENTHISNPKTTTKSIAAPTKSGSLSNEKLVMRINQWNVPMGVGVPLWWCYGFFFILVVVWIAGAMPHVQIDLFWPLAGNSCEVEKPLTFIRLNPESSCCQSSFTNPKKNKSPGVHSRPIRAKNMQVNNQYPRCTKRVEHVCTYNFKSRAAIKLASSWWQQCLIRKCFQRHAPPRQLL